MLFLGLVVGVFLLLKLFTRAGGENARAPRAAWTWTSAASTPFAGAAAAAATATAGPYGPALLEFAALVIGIRVLFAVAGPKGAAIAAGAATFLHLQGHLKCTRKGKRRGGDDSGGGAPEPLPPPAAAPSGGAQFAVGGAQFVVGQTVRPTDRAPRDLLPWPPR